MTAYRLYKAHGCSLSEMLFGVCHIIFDLCLPEYSLDLHPGSGNTADYCIRPQPVFDFEFWIVNGLIGNICHLFTFFFLLKVTIFLFSQVPFVLPSTTRSRFLRTPLRKKSS